MEAWQRDRITAFYEKYNPENLVNIPEILRVFSGREDVLCAKLHKKYGCAPDIVCQEAEVAEAAEILTEFDPSYTPKTARPSFGGSFDVRCSAFNAHKALVQNRLDNVLSAPPLDNMYKCRQLLPRNHPQFLHTKTNPTGPTDRKPHDATTGAKKPPILHAIAELHKEGPLSLLHACLMARSRVVVVVRRICSIRGTCTGYLKGFDKHMNVVLFDVTEAFIPLTHPPHSVEPLVRAIAPGQLRPPDVVKRFVRQLLIRGDNIVMVFPTQPLPPSARVSQ
ncbi:hypothetical protein H310_05283 [Aphanomyces invadans]|uniref:Sm domain-containing protein n=1 Tax=Aphanomyces invadans TaxID=157072 RepID=A0A024U999_9STRA|nr:hypothetical protein H310_05283 [Aphanomyces invadans]ETW02795.1 hypothetical protein H310_05283 [Aphanomyces invadans]|eukprot:XP_008868179.1 hypothetical protein H310_05283 [Aphanomyces invadans]